MVTSKQLLKMPNVWGRIRSGAVANIGKYRVEKFVTIEHGDTVRRMFNVHTWAFDDDWQKDDPEKTRLACNVIYDGELQSAQFRPEDVDMFTLPTTPKEFRTQATKGSRWQFSEDFTVAGYDGELVERTIPAGTEFEIALDKNPLVNFGYTGSFWSNTEQKVGISWEEKGLGIKPNSVLADIFLARGFGNKRDVQFLPLKEISRAVELVSEGRQRVYWRIENSNGEPLKTKRFVTLGNVKSSLRVSGGLVRQDENDNSANQPDYWYEQDNKWGTDEFQTANGVWAVKYDHATDQELERQDMLEYMTMAKLRA